MSISSVTGAQTSQIFATQQTAMQQTMVDPSCDDSDAGDGDAAPANSLTGSATGSLSSQTLQALMNLLQNGDPSQDASAQGTQASGAKPHHHHHHGGGGAQPAPSTSTASATASTTASTATDPSLAEADEAQSEDPLLSALEM